MVIILAVMKQSCCLALLMMVFLASPVMNAKMEDVSHVSDSFSITCPKGCTCGIIRSTHLHQALKSFRCPFATLTSFPTDVPQDIQVLILRGNSISSVPEVISRLTDLRELDLLGNRIRSLGRGGLFQNMTKLEYLNMGKNGISTIFHDNLMGLQMLKHLTFANNRLTYIEDKAFADLKNLQTLDLEQNMLGSLYSEWFQGLEALQTLNLAHNRIHNIPVKAFHHLHSLERLDLSGNRITTVNPRAFADLSNLQYLTMENNLLSRIPTAAFQSLTSLMTLTLDQNPLTKIKSLDFSHLSVTEISICQMPELEIIDEKAFYNLINISTIQVTDNDKLAYVDPLAFVNVEALKQLDLYNNNLQGMQKELAEYLPEGVEFSLYGNPLTCDCNVRWIRQELANGENATIVFMQPEHLVCRKPPALAYKLLKDISTNKLPKDCLPEVLNLTHAQTIFAKVGDQQVFECRALGSPRPLLRWILPDGSVVNSTLNDVQRRFFPPGTLMYNHLKPRDGGVYTCVAENVLGEASSSVAINVTGIDLHLFPIRVGSTFVILLLNGTERRSFPSYKILFGRRDENGTEVGEQKSSVVLSTSETFSIKDLHPASTYHFCIGYEDASGYWLQISCCVAATREHLMGGVSHVSSVAIFTVIVVILATTFMTCLFVSRKYSHRMYQTTDKMGEEASIPLDNLQRPLLMGS